MATHSCKSGKKSMYPPKVNRIMIGQSQSWDIPWGCLKWGWPSVIKWESASPCGVLVKFSVLCFSGLDSVPRCRPMPLVSGHAVVVGHTQKNRGRLATDVSSGPVFLTKKSPPKNGILYVLHLSLYVVIFGANPTITLTMMEIKFKFSPKSPHKIKLLTVSRNFFPKIMIGN